MPQTRFVTQKAFARGLNPIVVVNKVDRQGARPDWVIDEIFELFDNLGANDNQLDFPIVYTSALQGTSGLELERQNNNMNAIFSHQNKWRHIGISFSCHMTKMNTRIYKIFIF